MSGITSPEPLFSKPRLADTLSSGYFAMLGTLSSDPKGLGMMERWRMFNMFYHISDLPNRPDLMELFVLNMDFTLYGIRETAFRCRILINETERGIPESSLGKF